MLENHNTKKLQPWQKKWPELTYFYKNKDKLPIKQRESEKDTERQTDKKKPPTNLNMLLHSMPLCFFSPVSNKIRKVKIAGKYKKNYEKQ